MGIKAIDLTATVDYVSEKDTDDPKAVTVWELGMLDTPIRKQIEDVAFEYEATPGAPATAKARATFNFGKSELELVRFGLKGFRNFKKADGKEIYFKTEDRIERGKTYHVVSEEIINIIPGNIISELAKKIKEINSVGESERKN